MSAPPTTPVTGPTTADPAELTRLLATVTDPEIPVLTIADLGILRGVRVGADGGVEVTITPTYSGCPAMEVIRADVESVLRAAGHRAVAVRLALSPAWTTNWITPAGRAKLAAYGIAPPGPATPDGAGRRGAVAVRLSVRCPQCGSPDTRESSRFGSTPCKALYVCAACREPFDHFKAL